MGDRRATPYVEAGRLLCRGWAVARGRLPTPLHTRLSRVCREGGPLDSSSSASAGDWLDYISRVRRSQTIHSHSRSRVYRQVPLYHNRYRGRERHSSADAIGDGAALRREPRDGAKVQARSGPQRDQHHKHHYHRPFSMMSSAGTGALDAWWPWKRPQSRNRHRDCRSPQLHPRPTGCGHN